MSARAYLIRLAVVLLIFVVAIPGAVMGIMYLLEQSPRYRSTALGWGYVVYFLGYPLLLISLAIALGRTVRARMMAVGLPGWMGWTVIPLILADWQFFMWFFRASGSFLYGVAILLVALIFWPNGPRPSGRWIKPGRMAAIWAIAAEACFAAVSLFGTVATMMSIYQLGFWMERAGKSYAGWWLYVLCAALAWAVIEARRAAAGPPMPVNSPSEGINP